MSTALQVTKNLTPCFPALYFLLLTSRVRSQQPAEQSLCSWLRVPLRNIDGWVTIFRFVEVNFTAPPKTQSQPINNSTNSWEADADNTQFSPALSDDGMQLAVAGKKSRTLPERKNKTSRDFILRNEHNKSLEQIHTESMTMKSS